MNSKTILISLLVMITLTATTALAGVQVVANSSVTDDGLAAKECQKVFLGKQTKWSDGTTIKLGILSGGAAADEFFKNYVKKSPMQFATFWKKAVFSGTGTAPKEFSSAADMVAWVAATPGAVGFVEDGAATDGCKVLAIQ